MTIKMNKKRVLLLLVMIVALAGVVNAQWVHNDATSFGTCTATNVSWQGSYVGFDLWTPSEISTDIWLDASDPSYFNLDASGNVTDWLDRSGNGRNASTSTASWKPAYNSSQLNGLPTVDFDGDNDGLDISNGFNPNEFSAFIVVKHDSFNGSFENPYFVKNGTFASGGWWQLARERDSNGGEFQYGGNEIGSTRVSNSVVPLNQWYMVEAIENSTNVSLYFNGTNEGTYSSTADGDKDWSSINMGYWAFQGNTDRGRFLDGQFAEAIIINNSIDAETRQKVEGYLAHKWNLTANLVSGHPYKTNAPTLHTSGTLFCENVTNQIYNNWTISYDAPEWTPSEITTIAWFDATNSSSIINNSDGNVSTWIDLSGNGNNATQTDPSLRPKYKGDGIYGNNLATTLGNELNLPTDMYSGKSEGMYYFVGKQGFASDQNGRYSNSANTVHMPFLNNVIYDSFLSTTRPGGIAIPGYSVGDLSLIGIRQTGSAIQHYWNATQLGTDIAATFSTSITRAELFGYGNYTFYEIIYLVDNSSQREVEGYLAHKHGLTANLPSDHPYKTEKPYSATLNATSTLGYNILNTETFTTLNDTTTDSMNITFNFFRDNANITYPRLYWSNITTSPAGPVISDIHWSTIGGFTDTTLVYTQTMDYINATITDTNNLTNGVALLNVTDGIGTLIVNEAVMTCSGTETARECGYDTNILLNEIGTYTTTVWINNTAGESSSSSETFTVTKVTQSLIEGYYGYNTETIPSSSDITSLATYEFELFELKDNSSSLTANWTAMKTAINLTNEQNILVGLVYNIDWNVSSTNGVGNTSRTNFMNNVSASLGDLTVAPYLQAIEYIKLNIPNQGAYTDSDLTTNTLNILGKNITRITNNNFVILGDYNSSTLDTDYIQYDEDLIYTTATTNASLITNLQRISRNTTSRTRIYNALTNELKETAQNYHNDIMVPLTSNINSSTLIGNEKISELVNGDLIICNNVSTTQDFVINISNGTDIPTDLWNFNLNYMVANNTDGNSVTFEDIPAFRCNLIGSEAISYIRMDSLTLGTVVKESDPIVYNTNYTDGTQDTNHFNSVTYQDVWDGRYEELDSLIFYGQLSQTGIDSPYQFDGLHYLAIADQTDAEVDKLFWSNVTIDYVFGYISVADYQDSNATWQANKRTEVDDWFNLNNSIGILFDGLDLVNSSSTNFSNQIKSLTDYTKIDKQMEVSINVYTDYQEFATLASTNGFALKESCIYRWDYANGVDASGGYNYTWEDWNSTTGDYQKSLWYNNLNVNLVCQPFMSRNDTQYIPGYGTNYSLMEDVLISARVLGYNHIAMPSTPNFALAYNDRIIKMGAKLQREPTVAADLFTMRYENGIAYRNITSNESWFDDGSKYYNSSIRVHLYETQTSTYLLNGKYNYSVTGTAGAGVWAYYDVYLNETVFNDGCGHYTIRGFNAGNTPYDTDKVNYKTNSWLSDSYTEFSGNYMTAYITNTTVKAVIDTTDQITQSSATASEDDSLNVTLTSPTYNFNTNIYTYEENQSGTFRAVRIWDGSSFTTASSYTDSVNCLTDDPEFTDNAIAGVGTVGVCIDSTTNSARVNYPSLPTTNRIFQLNADQTNPTINLIYPTDGTTYKSSVYTGYINFSLDETGGNITLNDTKWSYNSGNTTHFNFLNNTALSEGVHTITYHGWDQWGNNNTDNSFSFTLDDTAPTITMINTSFSTTDATPSIYFNVTDSLDSVLDCILYLNGTNYGSSSKTSGLNSSITASTVPDGNYTVAINCTDNAGNEGTNSSIWVNVASPRVTITLLDTIGLNSSGIGDLEFNSTNLAAIENLRLVYNISTTGGLNLSDYYFNFTAGGTGACALGNLQDSTCYNDTNTGSTKWIQYKNGTNTSTFNDDGNQGDRVLSVLTQVSTSNWLLNLTLDEHYNPNIAKKYGALYNWSDIKYQSGADQLITKNNQIRSDWAGSTIPLNADQYKLDFRVNCTTVQPTQPLNAYICNSTTATGNPSVEAGCALVAQKSCSELQDDGTKFRGVFTKNLIDSLGDIRYVVLTSDEVIPQRGYQLKTVAATAPAYTTTWDYSTNSGTSYANLADGYEKEININWFYDGADPTEFIGNLYFNTTDGTSANLTNNVTWSIDPTNNYPPFVDLINPDIGTNMTFPYNITFSLTDPNDDNLNASLILTNSSGTQQVIALNMNQSNSSFTWTTPSVGEGYYNLTLNVTELGTTDLFNVVDTHQIFIDESAPSCTIISRTPSDIVGNSSGAFEVLMNCTDISGINTSRFLLTTSVDDFGVATGPPNYWSVRPPVNNLTVSNGSITQQILRAEGRNLGYWYESLFGDVFSYAAHDESDAHITITSGSNWALINLSGTVANNAFRNMVYLDKHSLETESKKTLAVDKNVDVLFKLYDIEKMGGEDNYTACVFRNIGHTGNPQKALSGYYCNSSFDPSAGIGMESSTNCVFANSLGQSDIDEITYTSANSSYSSSCFSAVNGAIGGIRATNISYAGWTTLETGGSYSFKYANGTSNSNVSFADTQSTWTSVDDGATWVQQNYTLDVWFSETKPGTDQFQLGYYVQDTLGNTASNFTFELDDIGDINYPITSPAIFAYNSTEGGYDNELKFNHSGTMTVTVLTASDPDAVGTVNHTLYLSNTDGTTNQTINATFYGMNGHVDVTFDTTTVTDGTYKMNVTAVADDNPLDIESLLTVENFTIDNTAPTLTSPANVTAEYGSESISADFNATDAGVGVNTSSWTVNDTTNFQIDSSGTVTNKTGLAIGTYNVLVSVSDYLSNLVSSVFQAIVQDTTTPTLTISYPTNGSETNTYSGWINTSLNENGTVTLNNSNWILNTSTATTYDFLNTSTPDGTYNILVSYNDTAGNNASEVLSFTVDTVAPVVSLVTANNTEFNSTSTFAITYNVTDTNTIGLCTLYVDGSQEDVDASVTKSVDQNLTVTAIANGNYTYYVNCSDGAGNEAQSAINTMIVDVTAPTEPAGVGSWYNTVGAMYANGCNVTLFPEEITITRTGEFFIQNNQPGADLTLEFETTSGINLSNYEDSIKYGESKIYEINVLDTEMKYNEVDVKVKAITGTVCQQLTLPVRIDTTVTSQVLGFTIATLDEPLIQDSKFTRMQASALAVLIFVILTIAFITGKQRK